MLLTLVLVVATGYGAVCALVYVFQERLVYFPSRGLGATPAAAGLAFEDVALETEDGVGLHAWFVPAGPDAPVVVFCHGNAGNISHRLESIRIFHDLGLGVLIFDYRGFGQSDGKPSEQGTYLDAEAAWRYLTDTRGVPPSRIVVFGRSLGSAVATALAARFAAAALIVESAFTSVPALAADIYPFLPVRLLARIRYDSLGRIGRIRSPLLAIHSVEDEIIPYRLGRALFDAAPEPKAFMEIRGGHNDGFLVSAATYRAGLAEFLARVAPGTGAAPGP